MPIICFWYDDPLNDDTTLIGMCQHKKRDEFELRVQAWCSAYRRNRVNIRTTVEYLDSICALAG